MHRFFSVTQAYNYCSNEQVKIEKVIITALGGNNGHMERVIFVPHICYHHCELKHIWMERLEHSLQGKSHMHPNSETRVCTLHTS